MSLVSFLKKFPLDIGQRRADHLSAGKVIAFSRIKEGRGKIAVDIGCRDGYWSERLKAKGYEVRALDLEPHYEGAIQHNVENGLPYEDKSVDLVWCTEVIEHLYKPEILIREIERVLRPGGQAVLTTPNSNWWLYDITRIWGWTPQKLQNPDHKQFFSIEGVRRVAPNFELLGYFPYAIKFYPIKRLIGFLSPTFILIR